MNIIFQGRFPIRTIVLIGVALLITTQIYAQNAEARLSLTLRNATLKEFVKRIENSTGYSFIYGEEIIIKHKINLQVRISHCVKYLTSYSRMSRSVISSPAAIFYCKRKKNQKP